MLSFHRCGLLVPVVVPIPIVILILVVNLVLVVILVPAGVCIAVVLLIPAIFWFSSALPPIPYALCKTPNILHTA